MQNLLVTAHLASPIIRASGYMTFDALLCAVICGDYLADNDILTNLPLANEKGLFLASAVMLEPIHAAHYAVTGSMRAENQITFSNIKLNKEGNIHTDPFASSYKPVMNSYIAITSPTARWVAKGDIDAVTALVRGVQFIGKRRSAGYGEVTSWSVEPTDLSPLIDANGDPRRPIPTSMFKGNRSNPVQDVAWMPAYWNPLNRAPCYAPSLVI